MIYFWLVICLIIVEFAISAISYFLPPKGKYTKGKVDKEDMIYYIVDNAVYRIACILTLGLVYLIRVIITESILVASSKTAWRRRNRGFLEKLDKKFLDE